MNQHDPALTYLTHAAWCDLAWRTTWRAGKRYRLDECSCGHRIASACTGVDILRTLPPEGVDFDSGNDTM